VFGREQLRRKIGGEFALTLPEQVVVRRLSAEPDSLHRDGEAPLLENREKWGTQRPGRPLVEARVPASLVVESDAVRIQLRVIPLRKAGLGETVRVLDPATRRVLVAQVAGEGLLEIRGESSQTKRGKP
jgi:hypothetical protein